MKKIAFLFILSLILLLSLIFYQYQKFNDGKLHIVICNIGQGDSIFIRTPKGSDFLIDGGPDDSVLNCLSSHMPFWDRTIEVMIMTHPDSDHSSGLIDVIDRYTVLSFNTQALPGKTKVFQNLISDLKSKNIAPKYLYQGYSLTEGDLSLFTVWPSQKAIFDGKNSKSLNEFSVIEKLSYKDFASLFTGDAGVDVEDQIAKSVGKIDLLKVPHHGSRTGMDESFLATIKPSLAVISVGAKNSYGHPSPLMLDILQKERIKTLRTDIDGEVEVITDGKNFTYKLQK